MNIDFHLPPPTATSGRPLPGPAPVQSVAPVRDALAEQRAAAGRMTAMERSRYAAELMATVGAAQRAAEDSRARKAVLAYEAIARTQEKEYVSRVLGISEFA